MTNRLSECTTATTIYAKGGWRDIARVCIRGDPDNQWQANADLLALAYDHALIAAAMFDGAAYYENVGGVKAIIFRDESESTPITLTPFGTPALTPELRTALELAIGIDRKERT